MQYMRHVEASASAFLFMSGSVSVSTCDGGNDGPSSMYDWIRGFPNNQDPIFILSQLLSELLISEE